MKADRLVSILLMLQRHEKVTAAQVAEELEVSTRTARRDLDALAMAGLPVYSEPGRHGGWRLLGGGRTDLSGFSAAEARALFMIAGASPASSPELRSALRKLLRALPDTFQDSADEASATLIIDPTGWRTAESEPPLAVEEIQAAVIGAYQIDLAYEDRHGQPSVRRVHPLGLVNKGRRWYLIGDTERGLRTFRADRVQSVQPTNDPVSRPADFVLADAWAKVGEEVRERVAGDTLVGRATPGARRILGYLFGSVVDTGEVPDDGSGRTVGFEVSGAHLEELVGRLAGLGAEVEITDPPEARAALARIGAGLTATYGGAGDD